MSLEEDIGIPLQREKGLCVQENGKSQWDAINAVNCEADFITESEDGIFDCYPLGESFIPDVNYAYHTQRDSNFIRVREAMYYWIVDHCRTLCYPTHVAFYAINFLDRILSVRKVEKSELESLGWICFYLSSTILIDRPRTLHFETICKLINEEIENWKIMNVINEVLSILGFRLNCPCPHTQAYEILFRMKQVDLSREVELLINCICAKYISLTLSLQTISVCCILVCWCNRYGSRAIPNDLSSLRQFIPYTELSHALCILEQQYPGLQRACSIVRSDCMFFQQPQPQSHPHPYPHPYPHPLPNSISSSHMDHTVTKHKVQHCQKTNRNLYDHQTVQDVGLTMRMMKIRMMDSDESNTEISLCQLKRNITDGNGVLMPLECNGDQEDGDHDTHNNDNNNNNDDEDIDDDDDDDDIDDDDGNGSNHGNGSHSHPNGKDKLYPFRCGSCSDGKISPENVVAL